MSMWVHDLLSLLLIDQKQKWPRAALLRCDEDDEISLGSCVSLSPVRLALWKKVLIGGGCLLAASVVVLVCVLCFRSKRGRETYSPTESQASFVSKLHEKSAAPPSSSSPHVSSLIVGRREAAAELSV